MKIRCVVLRLPSVVARKDLILFIVSDCRWGTLRRFLEYSRCTSRSVRNLIMILFKKVIQVGYRINFELVIC